MHEEPVYSGIQGTLALNIPAYPVETPRSVVEPLDVVLDNLNIKSKYTTPELKYSPLSAPDTS